MSNKEKLNSSYNTRVTVLSTNIDKLKDSLLRFTSSELTSHASNIIGLSIILFAYLNVVSRYFTERIPFSLTFSLSEATTWRYTVVFLILWVVNAGIIFSILRLVFYGKFASEIIHYQGTVFSLIELWTKVGDKVKEARFFGLPIRWFSEGISGLSRGLWFSFLVSFLVTAILIWTFLFC